MENLFYHSGIINYLLKLTTDTSLFDWNDDCEDAVKAEKLEKIYGYEIDDSYFFCEECKEYIESEAVVAHIRR